MTITGPFITGNSNLDHQPVFQKQTYKWAGKGPRKPMPYQHWTAGSFAGPWSVLAASNNISLSDEERGRLQTAAYDKFWATANSKANLGVSLLEGRESLRMVVGASRKILQGLSAVRRLDWKGVNRAFGTDPTFRPSGRPGSAHYLSNAWLQYTFGWVPLVNDIYSAIQVLQQDFGHYRHRVRVKDVFYSEHPWDGGAAGGATRVVYYWYGAKLRVTNPNALLANQLGLINPAHVLWDAVPYSFVIDWFLPVGKALQSLTNGVGLEVDEAYHGFVVKMTGWNRFEPTPFYKEFGRIWGANTRRYLGILPPPDILSRIRLPRFDPWLAATSVSLVIQQLGKLR